MKNLTRFFVYFPIAVLPLAAVAQPAEKPQPEAMAYKLMYENALAREQSATIAAIHWKDRVDALTKELADLKAAKSSPAPAAEKKE